MAGFLATAMKAIKDVVAWDEFVAPWGRSAEGVNGKPVSEARTSTIPALPPQR